MEAKRFGKRDKGLLCASVGATARFEATLCTLALNHQWIPPTINYQNADPVRPRHRSHSWSQREFNYVMSNSFWIRWNHSCVILGRVHEFRLQLDSLPAEVNQYVSKNAAHCPISSSDIKRPNTIRYNGRRA